MADETRPATPLPEAATSTSVAPVAAAYVALKSGLVIRHYVIEEVIGAGGFGITYRARHERLKSKVFALKEFFPREFAARSGTHVISTRDGEGIFRWGLDRFLKEAEALAKCEHPGIVDVVDYFEENGTAYAVLGYVEGQQLGHWADSLGRAPTQAELDRILMPLLDALEVVHGADLLHRDIAPDNILIRRDGSPCLIDFGACREDIRERSRKISAIVKHGYSPPEQYHGIAELQGPWTDIYAVGATLYRVVSGALPMDSSRRGALGDGLKPLVDVAKAEYRPGFIAAVDMALRLKPEERPQSIADWRSMLTMEASPTQAEREAGREDQRGPQNHGTDAAALGDTAPNGNAARHDARGPHRARPGTAIVAALAALAIAGLGAAAVWRSPVPEKGPIAAENKDQPIAPIAPPPVATAESDAQKAWIAIASTTDSKAVERFLEVHGQTSKAADAQRRLATLREQARQAEAARTEASAAEAWDRIRLTGDRAAIESFLATHGASRLANAARARLGELTAAASAERQRTRDAAWAACQGAPNAAKIAACSGVADGDDTAERRATALQIRGNAERLAGSYDKAIADLTHSLELAPGRAQILTDRGVAYFLKGGAAARQAALNDYDAAIRADPRHAEALNNRAWTIFQTGHTAEALADANRSIEASAANGYAYDTRGQILEALGRRDDAIRDYERAIQIDPAQETSRTALQRLRSTKK